LRTSCWLLPQNEQYSVFFESPPLLLTLLICLIPTAPPPGRSVVEGQRAIYGLNASLPSLLARSRNSVPTTTQKNAAIRLCPDEAKPSKINIGLT
jgi:hypothetical protein